MPDDTNKNNTSNLLHFQDEYCFNSQQPKTGDALIPNEKFFAKHYNPGVEEYYRIEEYESIAKANPIFFREIYKWRTIICSYFTGQYCETSDEKFAQVWEKFMWYWYWSDVYVCYSPQVLKREVESWGERPDINWDECLWKNPFRLFTLVQRNIDGVNTYASVWTGITYDIDTKVIPMVWATCNKGLNFLWWRDLIQEYVAMEQGFIVTQKLSVKRLMRNVKNQMTKDAENTNLATTTVVFDIDKSDIANSNKYDPFDVCPPEVPRGIFSNALEYFSFRAKLLGFIMDGDHKKEKITTGENFKDLNSVSAIQQTHLIKLNGFAESFKKAYPRIHLNFNVFNWGSNPSGVPQPHGLDSQGGFAGNTSKLAAQKPTYSIHSQ